MQIWSVTHLHGQFLVLEMKQRETQKYQNSVLRWANKQVCGTCSSEKPQHFLKHVQTWKIKQFGPAVVMVVTDQMQHISRKKKAENSHWVDFNMKLSPAYNLSAFCTHPSITEVLSRKYFLVISQNRTEQQRINSWPHGKVRFTHRFAAGL